MASPTDYPFENGSVDTNGNGGRFYSKFVFSMLCDQVQGIEAAFCPGLSHGERVIYERGWPKPPVDVLGMDTYSAPGTVQTGTREARRTGCAQARDESAHHVQRLRVTEACVH